MRFFFFFAQEGNWHLAVFFCAKMIPESASWKGRQSEAVRRQPVGRHIEEVHPERRRGREGDVVVQMEAAASYSLAVILLLFVVEVGGGGGEAVGGHIARCWSRFWTRSFFLPSGRIHFLLVVVVVVW